MAPADFGEELDASQQRRKLEQRMRARQDKKNVAGKKNKIGKSKPKNVKFKDSAKCRSLMEFDAK